MSEGAVVDTKAIKGFFGNNHFLSNFYWSPVKYEGIVFPTAEHAFQAAKTTDIEKRHEIAVLISPDEAKKEGRKLLLRPGWENIKLKVMEDIVRIKFTTDDKIKQKLVDTKDSYLEETNYWGDTYWGVCKEEGENHLGKILMKVRENLV
jgi:ribA/ribD-fused uncharacterized protein